MASDLTELLQNYLDAYPVSVFPVPEEDDRPIDSAAAYIMREMALPVFKRCLDRIEELKAEISLLTGPDIEITPDMIEIACVIARKGERDRNKANFAPADIGGQLWAKNHEHLPFALWAFPRETA